MFHFSGTVVLTFCDRWSIIRYAIYSEASWVIGTIVFMIDKGETIMNIKILPVVFGEKLYNETIALAKSCSFQGSGQYLGELMEANVFDDFQRVYVAILNDEAIGFCAITKETCCEDARFPWLDFLFVSEEHRKKGIAKEMVETVKRYAKSVGFHELYLCTANHQEYYKKLGFFIVDEVQITEYTKGNVMKIAL